MYLIKYIFVNIVFTVIEYTIYCCQY